MSIINSLPPVTTILHSIAMSYSQRALKLFEEDAMSYGLCTEKVCWCDSSECINNTPKMHALDLGCHLDDAIDLFPLEDENDLEECFSHMESLFESFTKPVPATVRLVWNLQAAGMKVEANVLYLSEREKGELVCKWMGWDMTIENTFNSRVLNGVEVPNFSYDPDRGLLV